VKADPTQSVSLSSSPGEDGSAAPSGAFTTGGAASFGSNPPLIVIHGKLDRAQRQLRESLTNTRRALALWCDVTQDGAPYMRALELTSRLEELVGQALDDLEDRLRK
jgi:hypothetical protein